NGLAWVARNSGSTMNLDGVAFGNGLYCAVGGGLTQNSSITRSSDGITWSNQTVSFNYLYDVTFGNGVFVVQGIRGQIRTSSDAVNWTLFQGDGGYLYDATFAQGYFVAGGAKLFGSQKIVTSTDGLTWISRPLDTNLSSPIRGVAYGNGYFVAVGEKGLILQSDPIFRLTAGNTLTRRDWILTGETGRSYRFQFSEDLGAKWIDLTNFMSTAETTLLHDPAAIDTPTRFYRVISP
ncbi:MAG TPA: hypothetical protein VFK27_02205, partial [Bacillales bacterium]|nr:hypothetical protein [Bacillales bacterium]